ncbi:glycoside hydrolase family 43 protein [Teredinibacter turnerae]|uniref:glycoside hydrolase family 43 protein n=1 Tax=Teredinibacter turnerae TaxID=2426 RepID=UPI00041B328D|nr:glycoside hydrolase family 43 protein [Teredinibacter turnerae]
MKSYRWLPVGLCVIFAIVACGSEPQPSVHPGNFAEHALKVNWFEYQGQDEVFEQPLAAGEYQNPILSGFYPDPSITRAGDSFYLVTSSFAYTPGIPIFRSTDLVNWEPLGHVLTRTSQLDMTGKGVSRGIYASTIRYHDGTFYVISTDVDGIGNFIVTSKNPAEGWSDPILLPEVQGIDPSMFFDDDGRVYITHNGAPDEQPRYNGHRAIWIWELDLETMKVLPDSGRVIVNGGVDISQEPIWIEGPHLYKVDGWYYLMCAEGGTSQDHSEVIFRSRKLTEPFVPAADNPILTQRDLPADREHPIATAGHADLVQTASGEWWAVFLATRNYDKTFFNTGRETFLLPVSWEKGWPRITAPAAEIPYHVTAPSGLPRTQDAVPLTGNFTQRDYFTDGELGYAWSTLRSNNRGWLQPGDDGGVLLKALPEGLDGRNQPAFIGRRQQHQDFTAKLNMDLPENEGVLGGLALFQNDTAHFFLAVKKSGTYYRVVLEKASQGPVDVVSSKVFPVKPTRRITLEVVSKDNKLSFYYQPEGDARELIGRAHDARVLSTQWAGGFVGTQVGIHARTAESILPSGG